MRKFLMTGLTLICILGVGIAWYTHKQSGGTGSILNTMGLVSTQTQAMNLVQEAIKLEKQNQHDEALAKYEEVLVLFQQDKANKLEEAGALAFFGKATILHGQKKTEESLSVYNTLIQQFNQSELPVVNAVVMRAYFTKATILTEAHKTEQAILLADEMLRRYGQNDKVTENKIVISGMLLLKGASLSERKQHKEALAIFDELIRRFDGIKNPTLQHIVTVSFFSKADNLSALAQFDRAIINYDEAIKRSKGVEGSDLVYRAMFGKAQTMSRLNQLDAAAPLFDEVLNAFAKNPLRQKELPSLQNSRGYSLLLAAKANWQNLPLRQRCLSEAKILFIQSLAANNTENEPYAKGNLAYSNYLSGDDAEVTQTLQQALISGGETLYLGTLEDISIHTLPKEDKAFKALLEQAWTQVQAQQKKP